MPIANMTEEEWLAKLHALEDEDGLAPYVAKSVLTRLVGNRPKDFARLVAKSSRSGVTYKVYNNTELDPKKAFAGIQVETKGAFLTPEEFRNLADHCIKAAEWLEYVNE